MSAWRIYGSADALSSGFGRRCADRGRSREPLRLRAGHAWEIRHDYGRRACQKPRNYAKNLRDFFCQHECSWPGRRCGGLPPCGVEEKKPILTFFSRSSSASLTTAFQVPLLTELR